MRILITNNGIEPRSFDFTSSDGDEIRVLVPPQGTVDVGDRITPYDLNRNRALRTLRASGEITIQTLPAPVGEPADIYPTPAASSGGVTVRRNTGADVGPRPRVNLIEGANVTIAVTDDAVDDEIDVTISAAGGGGGTPGGLNGQVQYNNAGAFAGSANATIDADGTPRLQRAVMPQVATPATPVAGDATLFMGNENGFPDPRMVDNLGAVIDLMHDNVHVVRNTSGAPITRGQAITITGATGGIANVGLAQANSPSTLCSGIVYDASIADNSFGRVAFLGRVTGLDTTSFAEGAQLYLSAATSGLLTSTAPALPNLRQRVAVVARSHATLGQLEVEIGSGHNDDDGTRRNTFAIGDGAAGTKTVRFSNGQTMDLRGNPTAARQIDLPDASGTLALSGAAPTAHQASHQAGGGDALAGNLDAVARTTVRRNSGADVGSRRRLNFIEGSNVTLTVTDDAAAEEVDITVASTGGGGSLTGLETNFVLGAEFWE